MQYLLRISVATVNLLGTQQEGCRLRTQPEAKLSMVVALRKVSAVDEVVMWYSIYVPGKL